jgi:4-hydroxy-tetrahydrodipicolinate synthase
MAIFTGSGVAIVTPFNPDGSINYESFGKMIEFQIENKTDAIIVCGTTGEASTLTDDEQIETIRFAVDKVNKRVPVIAGAGSNYTAHGVDLCVASEKAGADALLLVTPYYNKTSQKGLIAHYTECAKSVDLPIILYSVPGRTGLNISPKTAYELSTVENIVAIKEASGNISQIAEIAHLCQGKLDLYSGNDDQITPLLALGGIGVISVTANIIPRDTHNLVCKFLEGDIKGAIELQLKAVPLVKALFADVSPIPVKAALNRLGFNVGGYRKPLIEADEATLIQLETAMKGYGLI